MEKYLVYKVGLAILYYAVYFRRCAAVDIDPNDLLFYQGVHGKPGVDFPTLSHIPKTTFSCKEVDSGYYADLETDCQVFHICNEGTKISFLCPNGTIFQQSDLICDWWFKVNCTTSPELYEESAEHLREETIRRKAGRRVFLNENRRLSHPSEERKINDFNISTKKNSLNNLPLSSSRITTSLIKDTKYKVTSEETQVPQETASFIRDPYFKNNIRNNDKMYPNHRTTYSDLKDPKYFSKNAFHVSSTTSSSIKPEVLLKQKAPINNGKPFTATTVEGVYNVNGNSFQKTLTTKQVESSTSRNNAFTTNTNHNSIGSQTKKQTSIYINAYKTTLPNFTNKATSNYKFPTTSTYTTSSFSTRNNIFTTTIKPTTNNYYQDTNFITKSTFRSTPSSTTQSPIIKIALNNKQTTISNISHSGKYRDSKVYNILSTTSTYDEKLTTSNDRSLNTINNGTNVGKNISYTNNPKFSTTVVDNASNQNSRKGKSLFGAENSVENIMNIKKDTPHLRPKPFELPTTTPHLHVNSYNFVTTHDLNKLSSVKTTNTPKYKVSSPSPFINSPNQVTISPITSTNSYFTTSTVVSTVEPTEPTISQNMYSQTYENINNMISTLMELRNDRQDKEGSFDYQRPDLIIPPSVGPQTLHTLAVYFANALDSIAPPSNANTDQTATERYDDSDEITGLLSQNTVRKYNDLFKQRQKQIEDAMIAMLNEQENTSTDSEDLVTENSKHAYDTPNVRQLAKVFTEALSAYLDDPVGFKKDLEKVRPTDPPLNTNDPYLGEDEEVLNFSDADIVGNNNNNLNAYTTPSYTSPLSTKAHETATWGFILALNNSDVEENAINTDPEMLHKSQSQYYESPSNNFIRTPKVSSSFASTDIKSTTSSSLNQFINNEQKVTTSSLISLFNTQSPPKEQITAERQYQQFEKENVFNNSFSKSTLFAQKSTPTINAYTTTSPPLRQYSTISNANNIYTSATPSFQQNSTLSDFRVLNSVSPITPTPLYIQRSTTDSNIYTTKEPHVKKVVTLSDFTRFNNVEPTESAVAKLFNYFEKRVTPPSSRSLYNSQTSPLKQTASFDNHFNSVSTTQSTSEQSVLKNTFPTQTTIKQQETTYPDIAGVNNLQAISPTIVNLETTKHKPLNIENIVETQKSIYSDFATLNNLANTVKTDITNSYDISTPSGIQYSTTPSTRSSNNMFENYSSIKSNAYTTYTNPQTYKYDYLTNKPTVAAVTHFYTVIHPHDVTQSTLSPETTTFSKPEELSTLPTQSIEQTTQNIYGNLPTTTDVEARFASLVNKATSILSSLHNSKLQPENYQPSKSDSEDINHISNRATAASLVGNLQGLPENHWTTSADVTKLWQTTLYINPASLNQKLNTTEEAPVETTTKSIHSQIYEDGSYEASAPTYTEIEYDLQALPKVELNSTQVHGVLIDFINSTKKSESHKLERILQKLNTTEDEFLTKMKEIEKNPLTRRLILLLISECNKNDSRGSSRQPKELTYTATTTTDSDQEYQYKNTDLVQLPLGSEDQDARALDLLNSLYSIASKYGK